MNTSQSDNAHVPAGLQSMPDGNMVGGTGYPDDTVYASNEVPAEGTGSRWMKLGLAALVGLGLGGGALWAIKSLQTPTPPNLPMVQAPATVVVQPPVLGQGAPVLTDMQATLVMGEREFNLGADQVALPSGSRFQIGVESPHTGLLTIRSVNPQGIASATPLWSGRVLAGQKITTAMMRLEGSKGRETLLLHIQPENGATPVTRSAYLWHL